MHLSSWSIYNVNASMYLLVLFKFFVLIYKIEIVPFAIKKTQPRNTQWVVFGFLWLLGANSSGLFLPLVFWVSSQELAEK